MPLSKERWKIIESILDRVLDRPQAEQTDYLRRLCEGDNQLFNDIKALLEAERNAPDYIEQPAALLAQPLLHEQIDNAAPPQPRMDLSNTHIGPYRLCEEIGRGGMGVVYRAERTQGEFEQQVAIKLLWDGDKNHLVIDRFHREQQLLASLTHPGIAQLYDGGLTGDGHPYFVMEYVDGEPLDQYCQQKQLDINDTLRIILQVAEAISFAHKHLIVHRDIKPSNILVTEQGHIKLLDFGIAKLLDTRQELNLTRTGEQPLTPGSAAPEQLQNGRITIATDIYQLGLVAYSLLSGKQPYRDRARSLAELVRMICDEEPTPPSVAIDARNVYTPTGDSEAAKPIHFDNPKKRQKKIKGDLDAIVLKMLRHLPDERYSSIEAVKADIIAYFDNRPLAAQKHSLGYHTKKYLRRHWRSVSVIAVFIILLGAYAATVTYQAKEIRLALERSQIEQNKSARVSGFLVSIFKAADPNVAGLEAITAKALLDQGQDKIITELDKVPEIQAHMLTVMGEIYFSQGDLSHSTELLENALSKGRELETPNSTGLAATLTQLALAYHYLGRNEEAITLLEESLSIYASSDSTETIGHAKALSTYGYLINTQGKYLNAVENIEQAIAMLEPINNGQHEELAVALNNLASIQHVHGDFGPARENMRRAIEIHRAVLGEEHSYYSVYLKNFAVMLTDMEVFDEAQIYADQALSIQKKILNNDHPYIGITLRALGVLLYRQGNLEGAERYLRDSISIQGESSQYSPITRAKSYQWLGAVLQDGEDYAQAKHYYTEMVETFRQYTKSGEVIGRALCHMASLSLAQGQLPEAQRIYQEALSLMPSGSMRTTFAQVGYAQVLLELKDHEAAEKLLRSALKLRSKRFPMQHSMIAETQVLLGVATSIKPDKREAAELLRTGTEALANQALFHYGTRQRLLTLGRATLVGLDQ